MLEGKSMPSNMAANTNHATLLKNQSTNKTYPLNAFSLNFGCKIIFMCSVNFWQQQDYNSLFKASIGHVTSQWLIRPLVAYWIGKKLTPCLGAHSGSLKKTLVARTHNLGARQAAALVILEIDTMNFELSQLRRQETRFFYSKVFSLQISLSTVFFSRSTKFYN